MLPVLIAACCMIGGTVHTPSGAPIARAQLTLRGPATVTTSTDAAGKFTTDEARLFNGVTYKTALLANNARRVVGEPAIWPGDLKAKVAERVAAEVHRFLK